MSTFSATYTGPLATSVTDARGFVVPSAVPAAFGGPEDAPGPTDLLAASLGACTLSVLALVAGGHGVSVEGAGASVEKLTDAGGGVTRLATRVTLPAGVPAEKRAAIEAAVRGSPVHAVLRPDLDAPVEFEYTL